MTIVANIVAELARKHHVHAVRTCGDAWADDVTRLAGDTPSSDETRDLLVAFRRSGVLSGPEMTTLLVQHLQQAGHV